MTRQSSSSTGKRPSAARVSVTTPSPSSRQQSLEMLAENGLSARNAGEELVRQAVGKLIPEESSKRVHKSVNLYNPIAPQTRGVCASFLQKLLLREQGRVASADRIAAAGISRRACRIGAEDVRTLADLRSPPPIRGLDRFAAGLLPSGAARAQIKRWGAPGGSAAAARLSVPRGSGSASATSADSNRSPPHYQLHPRRGAFRSDVWWSLFV